MKKIMTQAKKNRGLFIAVLAAAALLLTAFPVHAQYESFFGKESWEYREVHQKPCYMNDYNPRIACSCCETECVSGRRDDTVTIGGCVYYRCTNILAEEIPSELYLREDTVSGRLYLRTSRNEDSPQYLICDLSLSEGDTFALPRVCWYHLSWSDTLKMVVDSVHYVSGKKVIEFSFYDDYFFCGSLSQYNVSMRFMEGVGPIYGIYPSFRPSLGLLLCLHKDGTLYYMTHEDMECYQYGADVPAYPQSYLQIYPNPTCDNITLTFITEEEVTGSVILRDMVGRVCYNASVSGNNTTLDLSSLPQGIYLLTYVDNMNRKITKKIIKK